MKKISAEEKEQNTSNVFKTKERNSRITNAVLRVMWKKKRLKESTAHQNSKLCL